MQTASPQSLELDSTLQILCSLKCQAQFTPHHWAAVLGLFPTETENRVLLGLSTDPFPDLGKLVAPCQHIEADRKPQVVRGEAAGIEGVTGDSAVQIPGFEDDAGCAR